MPPGDYPARSYRWPANPLLAGAAPRLLIALAALMVAAAASIAGLYLYPRATPLLLPLQAVLLLLAAAVMAALARRVYLEVIRPIGSVRDWASRVRRGDHTARFSLPEHGQFTGLLRDLSQIGRWYREVGVESEQQASEHVLQMVRKTRLLEILYDIVATVSVARDLDEVLVRFLHVTAEITHARAALVRLARKDGAMALAHAVGERPRQNAPQYDSVVARADVIPARGGRINSVYVLAAADCRDFRAFNDAETECVIVPLLHQGEVMGAYEILLGRSISSMSYDLHELLTGIGFHLGLAAHKARLDEAAQQRSISQQRMTIAHELHDSLAQSVASLRFQCKVLQDHIGAGDMPAATREAAALSAGIDRANSELRELMAQFRAPAHGRADGRGLTAALTALLKQFREENDVQVFSHFSCEGAKPPAHVQRQVARIVQEALANIHKHAGARMVRLLLRVSGQGRCHLLLEDDGHGFSGDAAAVGGGREGAPDGRHIGLQVMRERAAAIGATLSIESEPGEGTRVELRFRWDV